MPQPKKGYALGSNPSHERLMLANLALSLFDHEKVKTTQAKAKLLRPFAERLITKAKKGGVHDRRQVLSVIEDRDIVHKLFAEIAPRFSERNGGYTRILKLGPRLGDAAPMALIELVEGTVPAAGGEGETTGRRRPTRRRRTQAPEPEQAATAEEPRAEPEPEATEATAPDEEAGEPAAPEETPGDADADTSQGTPGEAVDEGNETPESAPGGADETPESAPGGADETPKSTPGGADETPESAPGGAEEKQSS